MRIRYPLKKPARVARRENFGDFKGVFKANRGGVPSRKPAREARHEKIEPFWPFSRRKRSKNGPKRGPFGGPKSRKSFNEHLQDLKISQNY